jgi:hypothetical protein
MRTICGDRDSVRSGVGVADARSCVSVLLVQLLCAAAVVSAIAISVAVVVHKCVWCASLDVCECVPRRVEAFVECCS